MLGTSELVTNMLSGNGIMTDVLRYKINYPLGNTIVQ